jgi:hypothetical protein
MVVYPEVFEGLADSLDDPFSFFALIMRAVE